MFWKRMLGRDSAKAVGACVSPAVVKQSRSYVQEMAREVGSAAAGMRRALSTGPKP